MVTRRSAVSGCGSGTLRAGGGRAGMGPNHFSTSALASAGSKSPAMASTAFPGPYQRSKKSRTSGRVAASTSSSVPMGSQWYGNSGSHSAAMSFW
jgi:hypothetical protein